MTYPPRHLIIDVAPRSIVFVLTVIVAIVLTYQMLTGIPAVLIRTALGLLLGLALDPVVGAAMRRLNLRRAAAVSLVVGGFLAAAGAFGVLAVPRAVNQLSQVRQQVPAVISDLDHLPLVGKAISENGITDRVGEFLDNLPDTLATRDKALAGIAQSTGDGLVTVFWVLLVAITALLDGPRLAGELRDILPPRYHAEVNHFGDLAYRVVGRYAAGTVFIAVVNAAAVTTIGLVLGTPLAPLVGVWSGLWNIVPQIGGFMGGATLVALSLSDGLQTGPAGGGDLPRLPAGGEPRRPAADHRAGAQDLAAGQHHRRPGRRRRRWLRRRPAGQPAAGHRQGVLQRIPAADRARPAPSPGGGARSAA